uniref:Reverse transcriptase domain-containing protein n=1 Tax=Amphimedon queenslandica TaxID=400682 RepID=A0A1X7UAK3_AMPQE
MTSSFLIKRKGGVELGRLEEGGIIRKHLFSEWAAPIVPVLKDDGTVRMCGDYKVTASQAVIVDPHLIPSIGDTFANMAGGTLHTKLDLSHTYLQLRLDDAAKQYIVNNTHRELYEYT